MRRQPSGHKRIRLSAALLAEGEAFIRAEQQRTGASRSWIVAENTLKGFGVAIPKGCSYLDNAVRQPGRPILHFKARKRA